MLRKILEDNEFDSSALGIPAANPAQLAGQRVFPDFRRELLMGGRTSQFNTGTRQTK